MPEKRKIIDKAIVAAAVTLTLGAARVYIARKTGYSPYCLGAGIATAYSVEIAEKLPQKIKDEADKFYGGRAGLIAALAGAIAYEIAFDGRLSSSDLSMPGLVRAAIGAGAALLGVTLGGMTSQWIYGKSEVVSK